MNPLRKENRKSTIYTKQKKSLQSSTTSGCPVQHQTSHKRYFLLEQNDIALATLPSAHTTRVPELLSLFGHLNGYFRALLLFCLWELNILLGLWAYCMNFGPANDVDVNDGTNDRAHRTPIPPASYHNPVIDTKTAGV